MNTRNLANGATLQRNSALFWFALFVPVAIIGFGINFLLNPEGASAGFGIPIHDPAAFPFMWIKGIRDIFAGLAVSTLILRGNRRTVATIYRIAVFIAVGDGLVILAHVGFALPLLMHWGTATYMAIVSVFLKRAACAESAGT